MIPVGLPVIDLWPKEVKPVLSGIIKSERCSCCAAKDYSEISFKTYKCNYCGDVTQVEVKPNTT